MLARGAPGAAHRIQLWALSIVEPSKTKAQHEALAPDLELALLLLLKAPEGTYPAASVHTSTANQSGGLYDERVRSPKLCGPYALNLETQHVS